MTATLRFLEKTVFVGSITSGGSPRFFDLAGFVDCLPSMLMSDDVFYD
jgi:hypothetical protein